MPFGAVDRALAALSGGLWRFLTRSLAGFCGSTPRSLALYGALWQSSARSGGLLWAYTVLLAWRSRREDQPHVFDRRGLIGKDLRFDNPHVFERCGLIGKDLTFQKRHIFERCGPIGKDFT